jgi:hypothetical protein
VRSDEHLAQLDKVAVLFVIDLDDTPGVPTPTNLAAIGSSDLGVGTDNGEGHLGHDLGILGDCLLIVELVARALEDVNLVVCNVREDLEPVSGSMPISFMVRTLALNAAISSSVRVSALAMTGIKLTLVCSFFITSTSRGFSEWPVG